MNFINSVFYKQDTSFPEMEITANSRIILSSNDAKYTVGLYAN